MGEVLLTPCADTGTMNPRSGSPSRNKTIGDRHGQIEVRPWAPILDGHVWELRRHIGPDFKAADPDGGTDQDVEFIGAPEGCKRRFENPPYHSTPSGVNDPDTVIGGYENQGSAIRNPDGENDIGHLGSNRIAGLEFTGTIRPADVGPMHLGEARAIRTGQRTAPAGSERTSYETHLDPVGDTGRSQHVDSVFDHPLPHCREE
jgi:hypothetical protein